MYDDKKYMELRDRPTVQLQVNDKFIQVREVPVDERGRTGPAKRLVRVTGIKKSRNTGATVITLEDNTQFSASNQDSVTIFRLRPAFRPFGLGDKPGAGQTTNEEQEAAS